MKLRVEEETRKRVQPMREEVGRLKGEIEGLRRGNLKKS